MAKQAPNQVLFKNVNVFNGTDNKLYKNHSVLVEGNIIKAISASEIKTNATVIDGGGRTLMPGLIDMHTPFGQKTRNSGWQYKKTQPPDFQKQI